MAMRFALYFQHNSSMSGLSRLIFFSLTVLNHSLRLIFSLLRTVSWDLLFFYNEVLVLVLVFGF